MNEKFKIAEKYVSNFKNLIIDNLFACWKSDINYIDSIFQFLKYNEIRNIDELRLLVHIAMDDSEVWLKIENLFNDFRCKSLEIIFEEMGIDYARNEKEWRNRLESK